MNKNKSIIIFIVVVILLITGMFVFTPKDQVSIQTEKVNEADSLKEEERIKIIAENLNIPWDVAFLPEGEFLITERGGTLVYINTGGVRSSFSLESIRTGGEGGLLGIALHPDFERNQLLYLYLTANQPEGGTENRVERYRFSAGKLSERMVILSGIPGANNHDGGRIEFGPDGLLYITTGDAGNAALAQDKNSLAGKILRINPDGSYPADNPFGTAVYSLGHRNPQGLAWDNEGRLWSTEHGRSGILSGLDEINLIEPGGDYGWPEIQGNETMSGMHTPVLHSGANTTWAPASLAYLNGSLFFGGLRGETLYEAVLQDSRILELKEHMNGMFGRIRTVRLGPDGFLYITTSNLDGRGRAGEKDDKLIRINPAKI